MKYQQKIWFINNFSDISTFFMVYQRKISFINVFYKLINDSTQNDKFRICQLTFIPSHPNKKRGSLLLFHSYKPFFLPVIRFHKNTTTAMINSIWMMAPPILKIKPNNQRTTSIPMMVHNIVTASFILY
jgi:hypothetical protein